MSKSTRYLVQKFDMNMKRVILGVVVGNTYNEAHEKTFLRYLTTPTEIVLLTPEQNSDAWDFLDAAAVTEYEG
jgi:hypothetical protein